MDNSTPLLRAIELPEILFAITAYLDARDVITCSLVCRSFHSFFIPLVWTDLHFGKPSKTDYLQSTPLSRTILLKADTTLHTTDNDENKEQEQEQEHEQEQEEDTPPQHPFLKVAVKNAASVRSLAIHTQDSVLPLTLGAACTSLKAIRLQGLSLHPETGHPKENWDQCKLIMRRNRAQLQSLSLINWTYTWTRTASMKSHILWSPILRCTQCWNLRSLTMENCRVLGRHLKPFWTICQRLEKLVLDQVFIDLVQPSIVKKKNHPGQGPQKNATSNDPSQTTPAPPPRFPRLQELIVRRMYAAPHPRAQLDGLIAQCPSLRVLEWYCNDARLEPCAEFCERSITTTWPHLDSIIIEGNKTSMTNELYAKVLKSIKLPIRQFDIKGFGISSEPFDLLKARHFNSIETIDLRSCHGDRSDWALEILTSCPNLRRIAAKVIHAQDFIKANKPWVCHRLQAFAIFIDMGFPDNGSNRQLSDQELEQCRTVFQQLAALKELCELDTLTTYIQAYNITIWPYNDPRHLRYSLVPLPMRLNAGLDLLAGLTKLQKLSFWGGKHVVHMEELVWMTTYWKQLNTMTGGWRVLSQTVNNEHVKDRYLWAGKLKKWLQEQGIETTGSRYEVYNDNELDRVECGDCCRLQAQVQESEEVVQDAPTNN